MNNTKISSIELVRAKNWFTKNGFNAFIEDGELHIGIMGHSIMVSHKEVEYRAYLYYQEYVECTYA
jgi:hypothetical protein